MAGGLAGVWAGSIPYDVWGRLAAGRARLRAKALPVEPVTHLRGHHTFKSAPASHCTRTSAEHTLHPTTHRTASAHPSCEEHLPGGNADRTRTLHQAAHKYLSHLYPYDVWGRLAAGRARLRAKALPVEPVSHLRGHHAFKSAPASHCTSTIHSISPHTGRLRLTYHAKNTCQVETLIGPVPSIRPHT